MYWAMLTKVSGLLDFTGLEERFQSEVRMKFKGFGPNLIEIYIYDILVLWYKGDDRVEGDVIEEIRTFLEAKNHDVISCQRYEGFRP